LQLHKLPNFFIWYWTIGFVLITSLWYRILRYSKIKLIPRPSSQVLEKYYLDPKVLTAVEISALKVRVFGKKLPKPHANLTQKQQRTHDLT
jgi:hypothetical protein